MQGFPSFAQGSALICRHRPVRFGRRSRYGRGPAWERAMKFYDCATAPSPRRVRIFLAEKGITVPTVQVNMREGEHLTAALRKINLDCTVPVLELDSGAVINDAIAICVYCEATHPEPALSRATARDKQRTHAWHR